MERNPSLTILVAVVDDDESVCRSLKRLLRSAGMDAQTFSSGPDLLTWLQTPLLVRPVCVVLDVYMPGMDGLTVQKKLFDIDRELPVVVITALDDPALRETVLSTGAAAFLRKPFQDDTFLAAITEAIEHRPRSARE